jgi:transcriptional regulator with XRE-family HTH domain
MDANAFRDRIARWRLDADRTQDQLDEDCGFLPGTVARLEQGKLALTDERLVRILICTDRDLLWTVAGVCGSFLKRLQSQEAELRQELGRKRPPQSLDQDEDFLQALSTMFASMEIVLKKQTRAADRRALMAEIFAEAAEREARFDEPQRQRASGPRKPKSAQKT